MEQEFERSSRNSTIAAEHPKPFSCAETFESSWTVENKGWPHGSADLSSSVVASDPAGD